MAEFAKGIRIREKTFDNGGTVINLSIDLTELMDNPVNQERYINLKLLRGKDSGKLYAVNDEYYQNKTDKPVDANTVKDEFNGEIVKFEDMNEEIPF